MEAFVSVLASTPWTPPDFTPWPPRGSPADLLSRFGLPLPAGACTVGADLGVRWFRMSEPPPPGTLVWEFRGVVTFSTLATPGLFLGAVSE